MKSEGIEFLYELFDSMGWDNVDMADIEVIMATVKRMESSDLLKKHALPSIPRGKIK